MSLSKQSPVPPSASTSTDTTPMSTRRRAPLRPETPSAASSGPRPITLPDLSDDALLKILSLLTSGDLLRLTRTCVRLSSIAAEASLWVNVDTGTDLRLALDQVDEIAPFLHKKTRSVRIHGLKDRESVSPAFMSALTERCPHLEELALKDCLLDGSKVRIRMFPCSLKTLRLANSNVVNIPGDAFFEGVQACLPRLVALDLSDGEWVSSNEPGHISRCAGLKVLNLRGCVDVGWGDAVGAVRFDGLARLDLRDTGDVNLTLLLSGTVPDLTHLYLGYTSEVRFRKVARMEALKCLTNAGARLMSVVASAAEENDDDAVGSSSSCGKLRVLSVTHSKITSISDDLLAWYAREFPLRHLDLTGSKGVNEKGVAAVLALRPKCKVVWDKP